MRLANDILPADRRIDQLTVELAALCLLHQKLCRERHDITLLITETYRSRDRHLLLWAQGRQRKDLTNGVLEVVTRLAPEWLENPKMPGHVVTWTFNSRHMDREAYDCVPVVDGRAVWDDIALWEQIGEIAEELGLVWGNRWSTPDRPHFQLNIT